MTTTKASPGRRTFITAAGATLATLGSRRASAQDRPATERRGWIRRHPVIAVSGGVFGVLVLAIVIFLLIFDWDWLRGPISRYASARTGREVRSEDFYRVSFAIKGVTFSGNNAMDVPQVMNWMASHRKVADNFPTEA